MVLMHTKLTRNATLPCKNKGNVVLCFVCNPAGQAIHESWTDRASLYSKVLDIHGDS